MRSIRRRELLLAVVLSSLAGYLDAVGFLVLGGRFVSFMSGNTTELAADAGSGQWGMIGYPIALVSIFFLGAVLGGVLSRVGDGRVTVLTATAALLILSSILIATIGSDLVVILTLPLAMGTMNATFLSAGEVSVGLTYMTGALVKSGQLLVEAFRGGPRWTWLRHLSLWFALLTGGTIGVLTFRGFTAAGAVGVAAGLMCVITVVVVFVRRGGVPLSSLQEYRNRVLASRAADDDRGLG